jgi:hypothetical protein
MEKKNAKYKLFLSAYIFNMDVGFACIAEDLEREVLEIRLNLVIVELATNNMPVRVFCIEFKLRVFAQIPTKNKKREISVMSLKGGGSV